MILTTDATVADIKRGIRANSLFLSTYYNKFYNGDPFFEITSKATAPYNFSGLGFISIDRNNLEFRTGYTYANFETTTITGKLTQGSTEQTSTFAVVTLDTPIQFAENKLVRYNYVIPENRIAMTFSNIGYLSGNEHVLLNGIYNLSADSEYSDTFVFETYSQAITANVVASVYVANFTQSNIHLYPEYINLSTKLVTMTGDNIKVGIGTNSPQAQLDVSGTYTNSYGLQLRSGDISTGTDSSQIIFSYNGGSYNNQGYSHSIRTRHNSSDQANNAIDFWLWDQSTDTSSTLGSKRVMTIEGTGRVGIGTSNPDTTLHLNSTESTEFKISSTRSAEIIIEADTDNNIETDNARITFIQDGGAVTGRIGYESNTNIFELVNAYDDAQGGISFKTATTTKMFVHNNGNIGVNTINPNQKLTVVGSISATEALCIGDATLDTNAALQINSTTRGFLPPRMTTTQRNAIAAPIPAGLIIYNTTTGHLNFYNGSGWREVEDIAG